MKSSNKLSFIATASLIAFGSAASAQSAGGLGYDVKLGAGSVSNSYGGSGLEIGRGIEGAFARTFFELDASLLYSLGAGDLQFDLNYSSIALPSNDDDDATAYYADAALHFSRNVGSYEIGGFAGYGMSEDNGDTDEDQTFWYAGVEARKPMSFGSVYGSVGYIDSTDEYYEGPNNAPFVMVGAVYDINDKLSVNGSLSYVAGQTQSYEEDDGVLVPQQMISLGLGVEYDISDRMTAFVDYEYDRISYERSPTYGDTFQNIQVGVRMAFGQRSAWTTPSLGRWTSFAMNELEQ